ncbi:MAG: DUF5615 family PIN-like protein [Bacteroidetes bacterium]|nr:DUF5615 family PIN-like protein [Bacteroidota bacterium]
MTFTDFSFIADENIDPEVINFLRSQSIKASSLLELDLIGSSDKEILQQALKVKGIILTQDGDFGSLIHTMNLDFYAIVYLRPGHFSGLHHIETLKALIRLDVQLNAPFIIVAENYAGKIKIRIRDKIQS